MKTEEYYTLRDMKDWSEDERWELIDGKAFSAPAPSTNHQRILLSLARQLADFFDGKECEPFIAPLSVAFRSRPDQDEGDIDTLLLPDALVVCDPGKVHADGVYGAPDWVLEILSPSTSFRDLTEKRNVYEKHGVREYWILNPDTLDVTLYTGRDRRFGAPAGASLRGPVPVGIFPGLVLAI